jgi:hypothetical protein
MIKTKRSKKNRDIDNITANDTLSDADLSGAVITFPEKSKKVQLNMRLEPELIELTKQIAALKHFDGYTQLLRMYIWEGVEKDKGLLRSVGRDI